MVNIQLIQLVGVILVIAGMIALTASAHLFGTRLSAAQRQRSSDEWNRRRDAYCLPISIETIVSTLLLLSGVGILGWSRFSLCAFLTYWLPNLPQAAKLLLSCRQL